MTSTLGPANHESPLNAAALLHVVQHSFVTLFCIMFICSVRWCFGIVIGVELYLIARAPFEDPNRKQHILFTHTQSLWHTHSRLLAVLSPRPPSLRSLLFEVDKVGTAAHLVSCCTAQHCIPHCGLRVCWGCCKLHSQCREKAHCCHQSDSIYKNGAAVIWPALVTLALCCRHGMLITLALMWYGRWCSKHSLLASVCPRDLALCVSAGLFWKLSVRPFLARSWLLSSLFSCSTPIIRTSRPSAVRSTKGGNDVPVNQSYLTIASVVLLLLKL